MPPSMHSRFDGLDVPPATLSFFCTPARSYPPVHTLDLLLMLNCSGADVFGNAALGYAAALPTQPLKPFPMAKILSMLRSSYVLDRSSGKLVRCDPERCPLARVRLADALRETAELYTAAEAAEAPLG
eukprot:308721-Chlamydomonas_euryale.AAC.1